MRYQIRGYTGPDVDFTDIIELPDNFDFGGCQAGDPRFNAAWDCLKAELLGSAADSDYLDVFDDCMFEVREDLADYPGQIVLLAGSYGCDNCQADGDNEWTDGCDDSPHGLFMINLDPLTPANCDQLKDA